MPSKKPTSKKKVEAQVKKPKAVKAAKKKTSKPKPKPKKQKETRSLKEIIEAGEKITIDTLVELSNKENAEKIVSDLRSGFMNGFTVEQCCIYAGLSRETYYQWRKASDIFAHTMDLAQNHVILKAKQNIVKAINSDNNPDIDLSKWWLERKSRKEFATRQEREHDASDELSKALDNLRNFLKS